MGEKDVVPLLSEAERDSLFEEIDEVNPEALKMDGLDAAIIGLARRPNMAPLVTYSESKIIEILQSDGMTLEEAWEYFAFNIECAWFGDGTPLIVSS